MPIGTPKSDSVQNNVFAAESDAQKQGASNLNADAIPYIPKRWLYPAFIQNNATVRQNPLTIIPTTTQDQASQPNMIPNWKKFDNLIGLVQPFPHVILSETRNLASNTSFTINRFFNRVDKLSLRVLHPLFTIQDFAEQAKRPFSDDVRRSRAEKLIKQLNDALESSEFQETLTSKEISIIMVRIGRLGVSNILKPTIKDSLKTTARLICSGRIDEDASASLKQNICCALTGFAFMAYADLLPDEIDIPIMKFINIIKKEDEDPKKLGLNIGKMLYNLGLIANLYYFPNFFVSINELIPAMEKGIKNSDRPLRDLANMLYGMTLLAREKLVQLDSPLWIVDQLLSVAVNPIASTEDISNLQKTLQLMMDIKLITIPAYKDYLTLLNRFVNTKSENNTTPVNETSQPPTHALGLFGVRNNRSDDMNYGEKLRSQRIN